MDDLYKNKDVRKALNRDIARLKSEKYKHSLQEFNSVDEIYFFMDTMFADGFTEKYISIALDVFLRDFGQFKEEDLESSTFESFVRELGVNLVTFTDEKNFVKTARFLDWFCVADPTLWINLETYIIKKDGLFKPQTLIEILTHFSAQNEGSRDFYDFFEFQYNSEVFKNVSTHELISLIYSFYQVHAGTTSFVRGVAE